MGGSNSHGHGGQAHGSVKEYVIGLILSIVFTVIPFGLVMYVVNNGGMEESGLSSTLVVATIIGCAIIQLLVQAIFFLHMNGSSEQTWNTLTGVYVIVIVVIVIIGSLWIFDHLDHNMLMGH